MPNVIDEGSIPVTVSGYRMPHWEHSLGSHASELELSKITMILAVVDDRLTQDLGPHLLYCFWCEKLERLRHCVRGDTLT